MLPSSLTREPLGSTRNRHYSRHESNTMRTVNAIDCTRIVWAPRGATMSHRFNSRAYCHKNPYRATERIRAAYKRHYRVWLSGNLNSPATNRGVGHGKNKVILCYRCNEPTVFLETEWPWEHNPLCDSCWNDEEIPF